MVRFEGLGFELKLRKRPEVTINSSGINLVGEIIELTSFGRDELFTLKYSSAIQKLEEAGGKFEYMEDYVKYIAKGLGNSIDYNRINSRGKWLKKIYSSEHKKLIDLARTLGVPRLGQIGFEEDTKLMLHKTNKGFETKVCRYYVHQIDNIYKVYNKIFVPSSFDRNVEKIKKYINEYKKLLPEQIEVMKEVEMALDEMILEFEFRTKDESIEHQSLYEALDNSVEVIAKEVNKSLNQSEAEKLYEDELCIALDKFLERKSKYYVNIDIEKIGWKNK